MLSSEKLLQYYDYRKPIVLQTNAIIAGLGVVLLQDEKPVDYASRSLSKSESNYAPIELKCLAIAFAMNKFDQYIFGRPNVTIHTDRRPLEAIMHISLHTAPKRIQAMMLAIQRNAFTVKWKPDKEQIIADLLSRHTRNCKRKNHLHENTCSNYNNTRYSVDNSRRSI